MENIETKVEGKKLILTIDTTAKGSLSKSGKTTVIASTHGNITIRVGDRDLIIGVNAYHR